MKRVLFIALLLLTIAYTKAQTGWNTVSSFGTNPGNLNMYSYIPAGISSSAPLVVVMHGCTQTASVVAVQSGWNTLADRHKFYVVYPEQKSANNSSNCFNWFLSGDIAPNQGESGSIKQMIDYMKANYSIDATQVFVTGLSAGACMTNVMMACYPDLFKAGAPMAGAPYKAGYAAVYGYTTTISPTTWGDSVRSANPTYSGSYPKVAVFQGSSDPVVNPQNEVEIMKQWTNVHGADQTADATVTSFNGNPYIIKNAYNDNNGNEVIETYTIAGMGHALALDTGSCFQQCGQTGTYAYDVYFSSTFWAAYFFGVTNNNNSINVSGQQTLFGGEVPCITATYSVPTTANTTYTWTLTNGTILSGQGTNVVSVCLNNGYDNVSVTETTSGCKNGPFNLPVTVSIASGINVINNQASQIKIYPNPASSILHVSGINNQNKIEIYDVLGNELLQLNQKEIDVSNLPNGIYFMRVGNLVTKFIKQ